MTTQELTAAVRTAEKTIAAHDECITEYGRRLDGIEAEVKEQGKLLQSIDRLAMGLTRLDEKMTDLSCKIDGFGSRINMIELKPAEKWERIAYRCSNMLYWRGLVFSPLRF